MNDKSTKEMKVVRDFLRHQIKLIQNDPYLPVASKYISARIVNWNRRTHSIVIVLRDERVEQTSYNSYGTRWVLVNTLNSFFWKSKIWNELNDLVIRTEHPELNNFPF